MLTAVTVGTAALSVSAEVTLATLTSAHSYVLFLEVSASNGDILEARIYTKISAGGAFKQAYNDIIVNDPSDKMIYSVPVPAHAGFQPTLKQTDGTAKSVNWVIYALDQI